MLPTYDDATEAIYVYHIPKHVYEDFRAHICVHIYELHTYEPIYGDHMSDHMCVKNYVNLIRLIYVYTYMCTYI